MLRVQQPAALGQHTGVSVIDNFAATPIGKMVAVGVIGTTSAKAFPGKIVMPFVVSIVLALAFGIVPDSKMGG